MEREVKIRKNKEFRQKMRELRRKRPLSKRAEFDNTQIAMLDVLKALEGVLPFELVLPIIEGARTRNDLSRRLRELRI